MLEVHLEGHESWDEVKEEFIYSTEMTLHLEHSLISVSKWEAQYKRPFITDGPKNVEEIIDYVKYMSLDKIKDANALINMSQKDLEKILDYINDPMTATKITNNAKQAGGKHALTSEEIYYYMTALNIPFTCEKWHLNRLLTLIDIASIKNQPPKKMGKGDILKQNAALNAARRAKRHSHG